MIIPGVHICCIALRNLHFLEHCDQELLPEVSYTSMFDLLVYGSVKPDFHRAEYEGSSNKISRFRKEPVDDRMKSGICLWCCSCKFSCGICTRLISTLQFPNYF